MNKNGKEITPEASVQKQSKVKNYDFKQIANELQEVLVKYDIYMYQFDPLMQYLKSKIMHETKTQKEDVGIIIQNL